MNTATKQPSEFVSDVKNGRSSIINVSNQNNSLISLTLKVSEMIRRGSDVKNGRSSIFNVCSTCKQSKHFLN